MEETLKDRIDLIKKEIEKNRKNLDKNLNFIKELEKQMQKEEKPKYKLNLLSSSVLLERPTLFEEESFDNINVFTKEQIILLYVFTQNEQINVEKNIFENEFGEKEKMLNEFEEIKIILEEMLEVKGIKLRSFKKNEK